MRKMFILGLFLVIILSVSFVSANDNETVLADNTYVETTTDDMPVSDDDKEQAEIIADDVDLYYSTTYGYIVNLVDGYGHPIDYVDDLRVIYEDGQEDYGIYDSNGDYLFNQDVIGNRKAKIILTDTYYKANPVTINVKISKSPVKINAKVSYTHTKQYATLRVNVKDADYEPVDEGIVKIKINGKTYNVRVSDGVAIKKIKLTKAKTYSYSATYVGNNHYRSSKTSHSKVYVYGCTKKDRTYNINGYQVTLNLKQYTKLINAKNSNKVVYFKLSTNRYVKQTYNVYKTSTSWKYMGIKTPEYCHERGWTCKNYVKHWISDGEYYYTCEAYKKVKVTTTSYKTVNAKVYMRFSYGGKTGAQYAFPNKYCVALSTNYQNPGYDLSSGWLSGARLSGDINLLHKAKVRS